MALTASREVAAGVEAAPTVMPPRRWVAGLTLSNLAVFCGLFGPIQVLIALQAAQVAPDHKEAAVGLVTGLGALASTVGSPLFGALSDRTRSRFGRRLPWALWGSVVGIAGLVWLSTASSVAVMALAWVVTQFGLNAVFAAVQAAVADQVPVQRRGEVGGWMGVAQTMGLVVGTAAAALMGGIRAGYLACAALVLAFVVPYVLGARDLRLVGTVAAFKVSAFLRRFWVSPRHFPDFAWAFVTRWLVNLSNAMGTLYLLYYLQDAVGYDNPEVGVLILVVIYAASVFSTAVVAGMASDRWARRKPFVAAAAILQGAGAGVLAMNQSWTGAIVGAVIFGMAYGTFISVDFALVTQVLPPTGDAARDLGVINIASALPQVVAPVVAAPLIAAFATASTGYTVLYAATAAVAMLGGVLVHRIRGVA